MSATITPLENGEWQLNTDSGVSRKGKLAWAANMCEIYGIVPPAEIRAEFRRRVRLGQMGIGDYREVTRDTKTKFRGRTAK